MTETLHIGHRLAAAFSSQTATYWTTDSSAMDNTMLSLCSSALMKCTDFHKLLQKIVVLETRTFALQKTCEMNETLPVSPAGVQGQQNGQLTE